MAWTAPMTWADGQVLTAAQLNLHLRDNLLETIVAKTTAASTFCVADKKYHLVERNPGGDTLTNTVQTIANEEYGDLPVPGPSLARTCGNAVLIMWACQMTTGGPGNNDNGIGFCSIEVTRAQQTTLEDDTGEAEAVLEADDAHAIIRKGTDNGDPPSQVFSGAHHVMIHDLSGEEAGDEAEGTAAEYEFALKYRTNGNNVGFHRQSIFVWPMS